MRRLAAGAVGLAAGWLSGCSGVKLAYSLADTLVEDQVDRYLDLNAEQEALADRNVDGFFAWHRRAMLPRYASYLNRAADVFETRAPTRAELSRSWEEGRTLYNDTVSGALPWMSPVLATQDGAQLSYLQERLKERADEIRQELELPKDQLVAKRVDSTRDGLETFIGELTAEQEKILHGYAEELFSDSWTWFRSRQRREYALIGFLRARPAEPEVRSFLGTWLITPHEFSEPGYKDYSDGWQVRMQQMLHELFTTLTPKQRSTMVETLRGYANDFSQLAS